MIETAGVKPFVIQPSGPNLLIRALYFVFVGWWLGAIVSSLAWFLNVTIIGLPLGLYLMNRLPAIITLRPSEAQWQFVGNELRGGGQQRPFWQRALYFVAVGWWFSGLWMAAAYFLTLSIIGLPLAFWMFGRVGAVTTLYRQ